MKFLNMVKMHTICFVMRIQSKFKVYNLFGKVDEQKNRQREHALHREKDSTPNAVYFFAWSIHLKCSSTGLKNKVIFYKFFLYVWKVQDKSYFIFTPKHIFYWQPFFFARHLFLDITFWTFKEIDLSGLVSTTNFKQKPFLLYILCPLHYRPKLQFNM